VLQHMVLASRVISKCFPLSIHGSVVNWIFTKELQFCITLTYVWSQNRKVYGSVHVAWEKTIRKYHSGYFWLFSPSHSRINKETRENLHIFMPCSIFFPIPSVFFFIIINMDIRISLRASHSLLYVQEKVLRTSLHIKWRDESLINKAINPSILSLMF